MLLRNIAETAYNVGYGAKVNFATFDILEKGPGLLTFVTLAVGVYALVVPALSVAFVGASMVVLGIISLYIELHKAHRSNYDDIGKELTGHFYALKKLYFVTQSRPSDADFTDLIAEYDAIQAKAVNLSSSKQILLADWYAHYKFFWQQQIEWVDEQKKFKLFRDKVPLSAWMVLAAAIIFGILTLLQHIDFSYLLKCIK
jgi:hypothetical protein